MSARMHRVALAFAMILGGPFSLASAAPALVEPSAGVRDVGAVWSDRPVRAPVAPAAVRPRPPHVDAAVPLVRGPVRLAPGADGAPVGAAFWLDRLEIARLSLSADVPIKLARRVGGAGASATVEADVIVADARTRYAVQGPSGGAVWVVTAAEPVTVRIETLAPRPARVIWETARFDLLDWADTPLAEQTDIPVLPEVVGATALRREMAVIDALTDRLSPDPGSPLAEAIDHWRAAAALDAWIRKAPFSADMQGIEDALAEADPPLEPLAIGPEEVRGLTEWRLLEPGGAHTFIAPADGALRLDVRAVEPAEGPAVVTVERDGEPVRRIEAPAIPAMKEHTPGQAFPDRRALLTRDERPLGVRRRLVWSLPAGEATLGLSVEGQPALVRMAHAQLRPLLPEWSETVTVAQRVAAGLRSLEAAGEAEGAGVEAATLLLTTLLDPAAACDAQLDEPVFAAAAAVECLEGRPDDESFDVLPELLAAADREAPAVAWRLRLDAARIAEARGWMDALASLLPAGPVPADIAEEVQRRRPRPPADPAGASAARAEERWRRDPASRDARAVALATWRRTRWQTLRPGAGDDGTPGRARSWLRTGLAPRVGRPDRLLPIEPGMAHSISAPDDPLGAGRNARLVVLLTRPGGEAVTLEIDGKRWRVEAGAEAERLDLAVRPGAHTVAFDGPPEARIWLPVGGDAEAEEDQRVEGLDGEADGADDPDPGPEQDAPADAATDADDDAFEEPPQALLERAWPVRSADGRPLRLAIEPALGRQRLRLIVRGLPEAKTTLVVRGDAGAPKRIDLRLGAADPQAVVLDDGPALSAAVTVVVPLAPTTRRITLEAPAEAGLVVRAAVRVPFAAPLTLDDDFEPAEADGADPYRAIAEASRALVEKPKAPPPRLRRAGRLLDLDLDHMARPDIERLRLSAPAGFEAAVDELIARYDAVRDPDHIPVPVPEDAGAVPLDPVMVPAEIAADDPRAELAREGRRLRMQGDPVGAARSHVALYRLTNALAPARGALIDLRATLDAAESPPIGFAALAFGVLARLDALGETALVSGVRRPAAAGSEWVALGTVESSGGYEQIRLPGIAASTDPALRARAAMVAAPWPLDTGYALAPGRGATLRLDLERPAKISAEVWCLTESKDRRCPIVVRRGSGGEGRPAVPSGRVTQLSLGEGSGQITADVLLPESAEGAVLGVRFIADRPIGDETEPLPPGRSAGDGEGEPVHVLVPARKRRVFRATPKQAVQATVAGPGAVHISAWRPSTSRAEALEVAITGPDGESHVEQVALSTRPSAVNRGLGRRPLRLTETAQGVILLTEEGAHRVQVRSASGEALVRLAVRVDQNGGATTRASIGGARTLPFDPLAGLSTPLVAPEAPRLEPARTWGTLSAGLTGFQQTGDGDDTNDDADRPETIGELWGAWRRRASTMPLWLMLQPAFRAGLDADPLVGGRARIRMGLPARFGAELHGQGWTSLGDDGWTARARLTVNRSVRLAPDWLLLPGLRLWYGRIPPKPASGVVDPTLTSEWKRDHPYGARVTVGARWQALRAQELRARAGMWLNPLGDAYPLDRLEGSAGWTGLIGLAPSLSLAGQLNYRLNYRFNDSGRDFGADYGDWAHSGHVGADLGWWLDADTRLSASAAFNPYYGRQGFSPRFTVGVWVDLTGGRGLFDFTPIEEPHPELSGRQFWHPPREGRR